MGCCAAAAGADFVAYCRGLVIPPGHGRLSGRPCPPRILNECIWLERNASTPAATGR